VFADCVRAGSVNLNMGPVPRGVPGVLRQTDSVKGVKFRPAKSTDQKPKLRKTIIITKYLIAGIYPIYYNTL